MGKIKERLLDNPAKEQIVKTPDKPALPAIQHEYENPWLEAAAEAGGGKILKFVKGDWQVGEDAVAEGTECIAYLDQLARAWIKFEDGTVVERKIEMVASGCKLPKREELGDDDPKKWEKGDDNRPRDPWVKQWFLPLATVETDDVMVFVTGSKGGSAAIGNLCRIYGRSNRKGLLPIVALKTRSYKHHEYGKIETPDLPLVGWHGAPPTQAAANVVLPDNTNNAAAEMNDSIPF